MNNIDIKIGQHCWAILSNKLLVVLKVDKEAYEVCGAWECRIASPKLEIICIIRKPKEGLNLKLYYLDDIGNLDG